MSPPSPQPKHFHESRAGVTVNDGVFSPWNGQSPLNVDPAALSWTVSPTTSTTLSLFFTSAAMPTAKQASPPGPIRAFRARTARSAAPDMTVGLSSLDKPLRPILALACQYLGG